MVASWSLGPLVEALRGLRGVDLVSAAILIASTGDLSRFESPRLFAARFPLCGEHRQCLPSEVFAGRLSYLMLKKLVRLR